MKALSLWQPHVAAIALGLKPWETRGWSTTYRGPLALHAAKREWNDVGDWHSRARTLMGKRIADLVAERFPDLIGTARAIEMGNLIIERMLAFGAMICIAELVDCVPTGQLRGAIPPEHEFWGDFGDGRYAFKLENVRVLANPLPWRGQQGFFEVELGAAIEAPTARELESAGQLSLFGGE